MKEESGEEEEEEGEVEEEVEEELEEEKEDMPIKEEEFDDNDDELFGDDNGEGDDNDTSGIVNEEDIDTNINEETGRDEDDNEDDNDVDVDEDDDGDDEDDGSGVGHDGSNSDEMEKEEDENGDNDDESENNNNNEEEEVDDSVGEGDGETDKEEEKAVMFGGPIDTPAFALLSGFYESTNPPTDSSDGETPKKVTTKVPISIPITSLPATLGRMHKNASDQFFSLGTCKSLSRNHAIITYRDAHGGLLGKYDGAGTSRGTGEEEGDTIVLEEGWGYKYPSKLSKTTSGSSNTSSIKQTSTMTPKTIIQPTATSHTHAKTLTSDDLTPTTSHTDKNGDVNYNNSSLPQSGFFAIECLGKNRIFVGKHRILPGEIAHLTSGTTIQISTYSLYFFLPEDATSSTLSVRNPNPDDGGGGSEEEEEEDACASTGAGVGGSPGTPIKRKRKRHPSTDDNEHNSKSNKQSQTSTTTSISISNKKSSNNPKSEKKSVTNLLQKFHSAIETNTFERKHQMMSGTIMNYAVRDASHDTHLQKRSRAEGGLARSEIIDWIAASDRYKMWVDRVMEKLEVKSYQSNISKALMKEGYTRIGTTGRHVKWTLPEYDVMLEEEDDDDIEGRKEEEEGGEEENQKREDGHDSDSQSEEAGGGGSDDDNDATGNNDSDSSEGGSDTGSKDDEILSGNE